MKLDSNDKSYTYQEIKRQQSSWKNALNSLKQNRIKQLELTEKYRNHIWVYTGCGTSYYLAQTASSLFEMITGVRTKAVPASEILMFPNLVFNEIDSYLLILISRSGTTTEIVKAEENVRSDLHIPTLAVTCDPESTLSKLSNFQFTFPFEQEKSVVMTGSFTTMLISILSIASLFQQKQEFADKLWSIADYSYKIMNEQESLLKTICSDHSLSNFIFLGQGPLYGIANEASLIMQEMSISQSQSFHSLEYRHGPMSTASENSLITILCSRAGRKFNEDLVKDLKELGSKILVFYEEDEEVRHEAADFKITVPSNYGDLWSPLLYMPILQLLGYYKAIAKNINPDNPRNLTAVVELNI